MRNFGVYVRQLFGPRQLREATIATFSQGVRDPGGILDHSQPNYR